MSDIKAVPRKEKIELLAPCASAMINCPVKIIHLEKR